MQDATLLPSGLPEPMDDGACDHLPGHALPALSLASTSGGNVALDALPGPRAVLYIYPMTAQPGTALPEGWDDIPGARGCTPQSCAFRDHMSELRSLGASVFGLSAQTTAYQTEMVDRLHLPFPVLSDPDFLLADALRLPTFTDAGPRLYKRVTLIVSRQRVEHCFYPVFPPTENAQAVIDWLRVAPPVAE